jgi:hypothetical protein
MRCQCHQLLASRIKKRSCGDHNRADPLLRNCLESKVDFRVSAGSQFVDLQVESAHRLPQIAQLAFIRREIRVQKCAVRMPAAPI